MKIRRMLTIFITLILLILTGCGGNGKTTESSSEPVGSENISAELPYGKIDDGKTDKTSTESETIVSFEKAQNMVVSNENRIVSSIKLTPNASNAVSNATETTSSMPTSSEDADITSSEQFENSSIEETETGNVTSDLNVNCEQDFELTISADETIRSQGENFIINVELKNNSETDYEISYYFLLWPVIPGWEWSPFGDIMVDLPFYQKFFEANCVLKNIGFTGKEEAPYCIGDNLEPGTHELKFRATFYLDYDQDTEQKIEVWSNPIILTVR